MKSNYPIPHRISNWNNGDEILYKCPKCGCDFRILSNQEHYCHNCGVKLNWSNALMYLTTEQLMEYKKICTRHIDTDEAMHRQQRDIAEFLSNIYNIELSRK